MPRAWGAPSADAAAREPGRSGPGRARRRHASCSTTPTTPTPPACRARVRGGARDRRAARRASGARARRDARARRAESEREHRSLGAELGECGEPPLVPWPAMPSTSSSAARRGAGPACSPRMRRPRSPLLLEARSRRATSCWSRRPAASGPSASSSGSNGREGRGVIYELLYPLEQASSAGPACSTCSATRRSAPSWPRITAMVLCFLVAPWFIRELQTQADRPGHPRRGARDPTWPRPGRRPWVAR